MKQELSVHLPIDMHAPDQLSASLAELQTYISALHDARMQAKAGGEPTAPELSEALLSVMHNNSVPADDGPALEALAKKLDAALKAAPVMHVVLAAPANRTVKRQLTVWFRTQIHPLSMVTFAARSDIGGGMILQAGSHMYDYSFRANILDNKKRLMELAGV